MFCSALDSDGKENGGAETREGGEKELGKMAEA